jgi:hypothetical protein
VLGFYAVQGGSFDHSALHKIAQQRRSHLHRNGSPKVRITEQVGTSGNLWELRKEGA